MSYDSKRRFSSYWHQINEIITIGPDKILEVGVGSGFVRMYLMNKKIDVITLDILFELIPDIVGDVIRLPFKKNSFDAVSCCEVLEHMPYSMFIIALKELNRISKRHILLSIPDSTPVYRINLELPKLKPVKKLIPHPMPRSKYHNFDNEHFWEIGKKGYSLKKIKSDINLIGFEIVKTYRIFEYYYHRIFLLEKK